MSDTVIFVVGLVTSLLLFGGLAFTLLEGRRLGDQASRRDSGSMREL